MQQKIALINKYRLLSRLLWCMLVIGAGNRAWTQTRVKAAADSYIFLAGEQAEKNFGAEPFLVTQYNKRAERTSNAYLLFELPQSGYFKKVIFNVSAKSTTSKLVDVFAAFGTWTDSSINGTVGNKPSRTNFIGSILVKSEASGYALDITDYINYVHAAGKTTVTLVLAEREQQEETGITQFYAKENSAGKAAFLYLEASTKVPVAINHTYYLDAIAGNDRADGLSPETAWKSLQKLETVFLQKGDTVLLKRGSVFKGSLFPKIIPSGKGITKFGAYGKGEKPVLDAGGKESFCLAFFNSPFIEVEDLTITQTASDIPSLRRGVYFQAEDMGEVQHVHFRKMNFQNIIGAKGKDDGDLYAKRSAGLSVEITGNNNPTFLNDYLLEGCRFYRVGRHGAVNQSSWSKRTLTSNTNWVPSKHIVIRRNVFEETSSDGLIVRVADGPLMEYNLFKRCSTELSGNASFSFNCDNALWQYNEACYTVYNTGDSDAAGFDSDYKSKNTIFQFNYAHHNEYGDILITGGPAKSGGFNDGTIVRYNVFYNNGHHGLRISGVATNSHIYNNVIYKDNQVAKPTEPYEEYPSTRLFYTKNWGGWPKDATYTNNIYYYYNDSMPASADLNASKSPGSLFFNNIIFANKIIDCPEQVNGITTDPMFQLPALTNWDGLDKMRYFHVQPGSPAIDAGKNIKDAIGKDFNGIIIPQNKVTDVGAFEYRKQ